MRSRFTVFAAALAAALGLAAAPARAFDTGHHSDLTREAMQVEGYGDAPVRVVQLQNWLVDYYSNRPLGPKDQANTLHFDNLFTADQIRNYTGRFKTNARTLIQQAAKNRDAVKVLTIMGMTLHGVQDFYSHSNWAELHPRAAGAPYRTETFWGGALPNGIYTGRAGHYSGPTPPAYVQNHGGYTSGINHDSYNRPRWDEAYVFAYVASREWVRALGNWVNEANPGFLNVVKGYNPTGGDKSDLDRDHWAAYRISEWAKTGDEDGHWKGRGSGSKSEFVSFAARWGATSESVYSKQFRGNGSLLEQISTGLHGNAPAPGTPPEVAPLSGQAFRAVVVRTLSVREKDDVGTLELKIDPGGAADFFAKITVAGQTFVEAMQMDQPSITPDWTTIKFVPAATASVPIKYELWDEDTNSDDQADIHPTEGKRALEFAFNPRTRACTGDINGVHDTAATAVTSEGRKDDNNRAVVRFYVTVTDLVTK